MFRVSLVSSSFLFHASPPSLLRPLFLNFPTVSLCLQIAPHLCRSLFCGPPDGDVDESEKGMQASQLPALTTSSPSTSDAGTNQLATQLSRVTR